MHKIQGRSPGQPSHCERATVFRLVEVNKEGCLDYFKIVTVFVRPLYSNECGEGKLSLKSKGKMWGSPHSWEVLNQRDELQGQRLLLLQKPGFYGNIFFLTEIFLLRTNNLQNAYYKELPTVVEVGFKWNIFISCILTIQYIYGYLYYTAYNVLISESSSVCFSFGLELPLMLQQPHFLTRNGNYFSYR